MDVSRIALPDPTPAAKNSAAAVARALDRLSDSDLLRLRALARLRARALPPGIHWSDLLHEALARALDGSRQWPAGIPLLVFIAGIMRSLCNEMWLKRRREPGFADPGPADDDALPEVVSAAPDQERVLIASDAVAAIYRLFAADGVAMRILSGLAGGMTAEEIRALHGLSDVDYDSARRRMRRALLRAGLSWSDT